MHLKLTRTFALALILMLALSGPLSAQQLFFTTSSPVSTNDRVMRIDASGVGVSNLFSGPVACSNPNGLAVDLSAGKIFVADGSTNNCIRVANFNGTGSVTTLVNVGINVSGLALDPIARRIYFTTSSSISTNDRVMRVDYNGTGLTTLFSGGAISNANGIALDVNAGKLFVANATGILAGNMNGTGSLTNLYAGFNVSAVAADPLSERVYFTYATPFSTARVLRVNYDGSSSVTLFSSSPTMTNPNGLSLDVLNGKIYIAEGVGGNCIRVANLNGTGTPTTFYAAGMNVSGITPVQELLSILGAVTNQTTLDTASLNPFSSVFITSYSSVPTITVTVTLDNSAKGSFTALGGFSSLGGGSYSFSGTAAAVITAIRAMVYKPTRDRVPRGLTETSFFTITASDGSVSVTNNTTTVISTAANHPPVANANYFDHPAKTAMLIPASTLLANDTDQDGDVLTLQSVGLSSTLGVPVSMAGTNVIYGVPASLATDTFNYVVNDAHGGVSTGLVTISISSASISLSGANKILKFTRSPNLSYRIQYSTNLLTTNWTTLATILSGDSGQFSYTNGGPAEPYRFYRAITP